MTIEETIRRIGEIGIVPVVRAASLEEAQRAVDAICGGGIPIVEVTLTVPNAPAVIRDVVRHYGTSVLAGAGTVLTAEQADTCFDAGAEFIVSPGMSLPALRVAQARGRLGIPGALTPSEVMEAVTAGAEVIKIFPCGSVGGPKYLKALRAPFPRVALLPTGGVNLSNAAEYIAAGAFALGVGADLVDLKRLREKGAQEITSMARELVETVRLARKSAFAG